MKKILLINPPPVHPLSPNINKILGVPHLGLAYIAAVLRENGFDVNILDMQISGKTKEYLEKYLEDYVPCLVGITAVTEACSNVLRIAKLCKGILPECRVVVGGPHATFTPLEMLKNSEIDVVVRGEGEFAMLELARYFLKSEGDIKSIRGVSYRDKEGKFYSNPNRPFIQDLDKLPLPARDLFGEGAYRISASLITCRGCPGKCIFCAASALSGGCYRMRSPKNVAEEFKFLEESGHVFVLVSDDTMTVDEKRVIKICQLLEEKSVNLLWTCESRVDHITRDALKWMHRTGCIAVQFGVETASDNVMKSIKKGISIDEVERAVGWAREVGMDVVCTFIVGLPEDTPETIAQTISFIEYLQKEYGVRALVSIAVPSPGTAMFNHADDMGIKILTKDYDYYYTLNPVYRTKYLTEKQIKNYHFEAIMAIKRTLTPEAMDYWHKTAQKAGLLDNLSKKAL